MKLIFLSMYYLEIDATLKTHNLPQVPGDQKKKKKKKKKWKEKKKNKICLIVLLSPLIEVKKTSLLLGSEH